MPAAWILWAAVAARTGLVIAAVALGGASAITEFKPDCYYELAYSLAERLAFTCDGATPELFRLPGYPAVLAPGASLGHAFAAGLAVNLGANLLTIVLVCRTVRLLGASDRGVAVAAMATAFDPVLIYWSTRLMSESVFTALVAWLVLCLVRIERGEAACHARLPWMLGLGGSLAALIYVRPVALTVPAALLAGALVAGRWETRSRLRLTAGAVLVCVALLVPWVIRNGVTAGYWGLTTLPARGSYLALGAAVDARAAGRPFLDERARRLAVEQRALAADGPGVYERLGQDGLSSVRAQPLDAIHVYISGLMRTLLDPGGLEIARLLGGYPASGGFVDRVVQLGTIGAVVELARTRPGVTAALAATAVPLAAVLVLAVAGFLRLASCQPRFAAMTLLVALALLAPAGGPHGQARFRHPVVPLFAVWAAFAVPLGRALGARAERGAEL